MYFYFARAQSRAFCLSCDPSKLEIIVSVREASTNDGKEDVADAPCWCWGHARLPVHDGEEDIKHHGSSCEEDIVIQIVTILPIDKTALLEDFEHRFFQRWLHGGLHNLRINTSELKPIGTESADLHRLDGL